MGGSVDRQKTIALIGMPGVGKSTIGAEISKRLGYELIDTDCLIRQGEGIKSLQLIIDRYGRDGFLQIESDYICNVSCQRKTVIATGGSVVYSTQAMKALCTQAFIVFLQLDLEDLKKRIRNWHSRGIVGREGRQSLQSLYEERLPLYRKYANLSFDCRGLNRKEICDRLCIQLSSYDYR